MDRILKIMQTHIGSIAYQAQDFCFQHRRIIRRQMMQKENSRSSVGQVAKDKTPRHLNTQRRSKILKAGLTH